jgi:hypothetical protein
MKLTRDSFYQELLSLSTTIQIAENSSSLFFTAHLVVVPIVSQSVKMFDVAWTEPVETVGQRKTRKDKKSNRISQGSSVLTDKSSDASSSPTQTRPSILGIFNHSKKSDRSGSNSKLSVRGETATKVSKRISTYTTASDSSNQESSEVKTITTRFSPNSRSDDGHQSNTDTEVSSPSDGK